MIRDKLVSKLKEKEKQKVEHFGERIKNAKETNQFSSSDSDADSYEAISDDENVSVISVCNYRFLNNRKIRLRFCGTIIVYS